MVFNDIVAMCSNRILGRLRSKGYEPIYHTQKRFLGLLLDKFLTTPWQERAKQQGIHTNTDQLEKYRLRLRDLNSELGAFEAADSLRHKHLSKLVLHISRFMDEVPLGTLLDALTNHDMDPNERKRLLNCLSRIAWYRKSAKFLCRKAEAIPILRKVSIKQVKLPTEAFTRPPKADSVSSSIASILTRISNKKNPVQLNAIPSGIQKGLDCCFTPGLRRLLDESKIHAEVQILAHYEGCEPNVVPPRVIASNKDACYLCNTLISLHGQYSVPKTHGRLYSRWRLPATRQYKPLLQRLNSFLEQEIRATVQMLKNREKMLAAPFQNESTIFPLMVSASTVAGGLHPTPTRASNNSKSHLTPVVVKPSGLVQEPPAVLEKSINVTVANNKPENPVNHGPQPGSPVNHGARQSNSASGPIKNDSKDKISTLAKMEANKVDADSIENIDDSKLPAGETVESPNSRPDTVVVDIDSSLTRNENISPSVLKRKESRTAVFDRSVGSRTWFRYDNLEIFIDESSLEFSHKQLNKSEAAEVLRSKSEMVTDVRMLAVGEEMTLRKGPDGDGYFTCGGTAPSPFVFSILTSLQQASRLQTREIANQRKQDGSSDV